MRIAVSFPFFRPVQEDGLSRLCTVVRQVWVRWSCEVVETGRYSSVLGGEVWLQQQKSGRQFSLISPSQKVHNTIQIQSWEKQRSREKADQERSVTTKKDSA